MFSRFKNLGAANTLGAMVDDEGNIHAGPVIVAELLRNRWSQVFKDKPTNRPNLAHWLKTAYPEGPPCKVETNEWIPKFKNEEPSNSLTLRRRARTVFLI